MVSPQLKCTFWHNACFSREFVVLGTLLLLVSSCYSQSREGLFWHYTVNDGLPSNEVYHIHEDKDGYMWFATSNGISRYDGYEFINYSLNEGVGDADIFQIEEGSYDRFYLYGISGRVYEGNADGFKLYRYQYKIDSTIAQWNSSSNFRERIPYPFGHIRLKDNDLLHYIQQGLYLTINKSGEVNFKNFESFDINIIDQNEELILINPPSVKLRAFRDSLKVNHGIQPLKLFSDKTYQFNIYIGKEYAKKASGNGKWLSSKILDNKYLFWYDQRIFITSKDSMLWRSELLPSTEVIKLFKEIIFTGQTNGKGVKVYLNLGDFKKNTFDSFLYNYSISFIHLDQHDDLWISTTNAGVFRVHFRTLTNGSLNQAHQQETYNLISSNKKDVLYLSNDKEQIMSLDVTNGMIDTIRKAPGIRIKDLQFDTSINSLWYTDVTLNRIYEEAHQTIFAYNTFRESFNTSKWIENTTTGGNQLYIDNESSDIWISGSDGFSKYDKAVQRVTLRKWTTINEGVLRIYSIYPEKDSLTWLGTQSGVFMYNLDTVQISKDPILSQDVPITNIVTCEHGLFFGTKGLGIYQSISGKTRVINAKDGLSSNYVDALMELNGNEIWVGTTNGLDRIIFEDSLNYKIQHYSIATGLPSNGINDLEYCNGKVYVATLEGIGVIDPNDTLNVDPVRPLISGININGQKAAIEEVNQLKNSESNLIISFDCLDYRQLGQILYRYKISEADEWHETKERSVNFPRLSAGQYNFEVQAKGADKSWSNSAQLVFAIAKPFWQRIWFWITIAGLIIFAFYIYARSKLLEAKREHEIQNKINKLERSALRAQMNPHFIFNVLQSIQSYIAEGDASSATRFVSKFARLIRTTLNSSRSSKIALADEIDYLKEYLDLENMRLNDRLTYRFHLDKNIDESEIDIPPMLIQPFLENSIKHGISPKPGPGIIDIAFHLEDQYLKVEIVDNGIGIEESKKQKQEKLKSERSLGVEITQQRLSFLSENIKKEVVSITELHDNLGNILGTKAILSIRLK